MPLRSFASISRNLSFAVMAATFTPASAMAASTVPQRIRRGVRDHALLACSAVEIVVAGDAVNGRRCARDKRGIVGIGEGGHHRIGFTEEAAAAETCHGRQDPVRDAARDIGGVAAVIADDGSGAPRQTVGAAIAGDLGHGVLGRRDLAFAQTQSLLHR